MKDGRLNTLLLSNMDKVGALIYWTCAVFSGIARKMYVVYVLTRPIHSHMTKRIHPSSNYMYNYMYNAIGCYQKSISAATKSKSHCT